MVQLQKNVILNKGDFEKHLLPTGIDITSIKADKPIMVYKLGGFDRELGGGLLTPIADCKGTHLLAFQYPTLAVEAVFSFVAPDAILGNFLLNGNSSIITAADFLPIPGISGWKYVRKAVTGIFTPCQVINIENTAGNFYFYQNMRTSGAGDYSNFSDFGNVVLFPKAEHTCASNAITLTSGAIGYNASLQCQRI
ncbi:MAG: hypothetical protein RSF34_13680 [Flavobacterium sp.]|uniref:hypothetical protein n=1 Tax=unclassified Flavobacterium TaxID=196869 RepID=UPI000C17FACE|nr:hypothetical protein [Flavobacterium sp. 2]PIF70684.1 hypothetical protein CLU99_1429 [Flavobacterium sp. 2]